MADPLEGLPEEDRTYMAVLDVASAIATASLNLPVEVVETAVAFCEKALADDKGEANPQAITDVKAQLAFLTAFLTFRRELDQFTEEPPPPSEVLRPPGGVSPGGVVLP